ncbi:glycosyltransferase [Endozoicomonas sp. SCSIO W0465]|uniref:glycosyltransferase n=1 Tax=Endozoicomonas sp. SCSIO W0465 TaxID=2918516 RepID=UPI00207541C5|nr:glycosyltransferase [Endozoicomonas sp. SCSIO W0465]USE33913.1 glycosyltransferase [Endozoicomonas sp. SCSIO W0465]
MNVLHFFKTYYPDSYGGVENLIFQLAENGLKQGVQSEVLSLSSNGCARNQRVNNHLVHRSNLDFYLASTGFSYSVFSDFRELADNADIIHYHFPWPFMDVVHFVNRIKKPTVVTYHSDIVKQKYLYFFYKPLMYFFLKSVDRVIATSSNYLNTSCVLKNIKKKVDVIPVGIDDHAAIPASNLLKLKWQQTITSPFFLFIGSFRYYKGLHILLESMKGVDLPVVLVGIGSLEKELKIQAQQLNLKNIYFLGALPDEDKCALLELCLSVVFPSHLRSEAFGITLVEGAMYGKPLISSEIGTGTTYINVDHETGLVVPPSNPTALKAAMLTLWNNPVLAFQLGRNARVRYEKLFTVDRMVKQYAHIYYSLLS